MARVNANTVVLNGFTPVSLYAGDEVPEWAADQVGEHLLSDVEPPQGVEVPEASADKTPRRARG